MRTGSAGVWFVPVAAVAVFVGVLAVSAGTSHHIGDFTRDPTAVLDASPFTGAISNLGVVLWAAGVTLALVGRARGDDRRALFGSLAALGAWLLLDDLFLLHDRVLPDLGVPEEVVLVAEIVATAALLAPRWRLLVATAVPLLVLAAMGFAASLVLDEILGASGLLVAAEDGTKFVAIAAWVAWLADMVAAQPAPGAG